MKLYSEKELLEIHDDNIHDMALNMKAYNFPNSAKFYIIIHQIDI
jgi:hypothetical protein